MTQRDYVKLAAIVGNGFAAMQSLDAGSEEAYRAFYDNLYEPLCEMLKADNPRFDQTKFCFAVAQARDSGK